jgi:2-phospho-L-lactate guanylyltransferase
VSGSVTSASQLPPRSAWAVVPVKALDDAKQRLAASYAPAIRRALAEAMLTDVLTAIHSAADDLAGLLVVTADPEAAALAARFGAVVEAGDATQGQTAAVTSAAWRLAREGCVAMLALPGDIPGITAKEIRAMLAAHRGGRDYVIVPAHDRRGSNAILVSPPDAVPFAFGNDSFLPHLAAAQGAGFDPVILALPGIGLDCDNPEDLAQFALRPTDTHTARLLADLGRPPAGHA